ncbi:hypothetical protein [Janibacter cremeus]|uniref:Uncharacterized protein n=1 Tax=Janibacter cremeus TaxID=1285192 RepID=A0A852VPQ8_9MICO|nr:hypothetical protein [Janibacter cremeus]NYF99017.1 hypothetical protein [Janibacter cremeus]
MHRLVLNVSHADLVAVSNAHVFFAHQSVGRAVLDAVPRLYATHDLPAPRVAELADAEPGDHLVHTRIGENGDPLGKVDEYAALVRGGIGDWADAAVLKLCYADIRAGSDVTGIFAAYRDTLSALSTEYPNVAFVPATVPLTTKRGRVATLKGWLGRGDRHGPEHNIARDDFNALVRAEHPRTERLFDIASIESTAKSGHGTVGWHRGRTYHALDRARARDHGHLNEDGADTVAADLITVIATALRE